MARVGRKSSKRGIMPEHKKRSPDRGTQEFRAKRIAIVGVENATHQAAGDVLGILMLRGLISDPQRAAGARYALLRGRVCGSPHGSTGSYGERTEASTHDGPSRKDERNWVRCLKAIEPLGKEAKIELDNTAVFNRLPEWIDRPGEQHRLLVAALKKLENVT